MHTMYINGAVYHFYMPNVLDMLLFHHILNAYCCFQAQKNVVQ